MSRSKADVWDLTTKEGGDHVLIALTVDECNAILDALNDRDKGPYDHMSSAYRAHQQIRWSLRDQKGEGQ
jgi:hypothetical protein